MTTPLDILLLVVSLLGCGVVAGLLAGLLGVGGGIVIVPMLYHLFTAYGIAPNMAMPLSVGTSLSTIVFTAWMSARTHHRRGSVDWAFVRRWTAPVLLGVIAGSFLAHDVSGTSVKAMFGVLLMLVSTHMLYTARHSLSLFERLPGRTLQAGFGTVVGALSSMLGIGGGTLMVPLLSLFSYPIHRAVATSSVFGFIIAVPATIGYVISGWQVADLPLASTGYVNWLAFAALVPATMLFAPVGARLAYRLNVNQLKRAFGVFLFVVGLKMALL